jgi:hypothetical protein
VEPPSEAITGTAPRRLLEPFNPASATGALDEVEEKLGIDESVGSVGMLGVLGVEAGVIDATGDGVGVTTTGGVGVA